MYLKFKSSIKDSKYSVDTLTQKSLNVDLTNLLLMVYRAGCRGEYIDIYDKDGCIYDRTWGRK